MFIIISIFAVCVNAAVLVAGYKMINRRLDKMQASIIVEINNVLDTVSPSPYDDAPDFAVETETAAPVETVETPVVKMAVVETPAPVETVENTETPAAEPSGEKKAGKKPTDKTSNGGSSKKVYNVGDTKTYYDHQKEDGKWESSTEFHEGWKVRVMVYVQKEDGSFTWKRQSSIDKEASKKNEVAANDKKVESTDKKEDTKKADKGVKKAGKKVETPAETVTETAPEFETAGQHTKGDLIEMTMNAFKTESILIKDLGVTFSAGATTPVIIAVLKKDGVLMFTHQNTDCTKILTKTCSSNFISRDLMAQIYEAVTTSVLAEWHTAHPAKKAE